MIRPTAPRGTSPAAGARGARSAGGAFRIDATVNAANAAVPASPAPAAEILGALIDLQGIAAHERERRRKIVAAQWTLSLLDRIRLGLLDGASSSADLEALAAAASSADAEPDEVLQAALDEVSLRARVELAKRGR